MKDIKFYHRVQLPDGSYTPGTCNHGPDGGNWPTERFGMPLDLTGKSVLDIGAYDGFFSFEAEKRGGRVRATNPSAPKGPSWSAFSYLHKELNSKVASSIVDIEALDENDWLEPYPYNVVLFYGVLYHLKSPLVAMDNVAKLTAPGGMCLLETAMSMNLDVNGPSPPALEYGPNTEGDPTNYFYPNRLWIETAAKEVGFKAVEHVYTIHNRSTFRLLK